MLIVIHRFDLGHGITARICSSLSIEMSGFSLEVPLIGELFNTGSFFRAHGFGRGIEVYFPKYFVSDVTPPLDTDPPILIGISKWMWRKYNYRVVVDTQAECGFEIYNEHGQACSIGKNAQLLGGVG